VELKVDIVCFVIYDIKSIFETKNRGKERGKMKKIKHALFYFLAICFVLVLGYFVTRFVIKGCSIPSFIGETVFQRSEIVKALGCRHEALLLFTRDGCVIMNGPSERLKAFVGKIKAGEPIYLLVTWPNDLTRYGSHNLGEIKIISSGAIYKRGWLE